MFALETTCLKCLRLSALFFFVTAAAAPALPGWRLYEKCVLLPNEANDGDSFHVQAGKSHLLFRLYYVDAPETDERIPERVREQAAYWGISEAQTLALGHAAARFTKKFLAGEFSVYTRGEDAMGASKMERLFAMVKVDGRWLDEALVENGLARIYGSTRTLSDGTSVGEHLKRLGEAEQRAKRAGLGGWRYRAARRTGAAGLVPPVATDEVTLRSRTAIYSLDEPPRFLGTLAPGTVVTVVEAVSPFMVKLRYTQDGAEREAQCGRQQLGAPR